MHTTTEMTNRPTTIRRLALAALAAAVLVAVLMVRMAASGGADPQVQDKETPNPDVLVTGEPLSADPTVGETATVPSVVGEQLGKDDAATVVLTDNGDDDPRPPGTTSEGGGHDVIPEDRDARTPSNTAPRWEAVVTPAHPVVGDEVTVEIHWADDEADTVVAESWCRPSGPAGGTLCADDFLGEPCDGPQDAEVAPKPGAGVLRFRFEATTVGTVHWDHGVVLRSLPADLHEDCVRYDPFQDGFLASGSIDVGAALHADRLDAPASAVPVG